jgi:hypothetical protein
VREWHLRLAYDHVNCLVVLAVFPLQLYVGASMLLHDTSGRDAESNVIAVFIVTGLEMVAMAVVAAYTVYDDDEETERLMDDEEDLELFANWVKFCLMIFPGSLVAPVLPLALWIGRLRVGARYDKGTDDAGGVLHVTKFESAAAAEVLGAEPLQCRDTPFWCWHQKSLFYTFPLFAVNVVMMASIGLASMAAPSPTTPLFEWLLLLNGVALLMPVHYHSFTTDDAIHRCFQCLGWHDGASFLYVVFVLIGAFQFGDGSAAATADAIAERWLLLWFAVATVAWFAVAIIAVAVRRAVADLHDPDLRWPLITLTTVLSVPYHISGKGRLTFELIRGACGDDALMWLALAWRFTLHGQTELREASAAVAKAEFRARMRHLGEASLREGYAALQLEWGDAMVQAGATPWCLVRPPAAAIDDCRHGPPGAADGAAWRLHVYAELFDLCAATGPYDYAALADAGRRARARDAADNIWVPRDGVLHSEQMLHYVIVSAPPMALWALFPAVAAAQATAAMSVVRGVMLAVLAASLVGALLLSPRVHRYRTFCLAVAPLRCLRDLADEERALLVARYVREYFRVTPLVLLQHAIDPAVLPLVVLRDHVAPLLPINGALDKAARKLSPGECLDLLAVPQ